MTKVKWFGKKGWLGLTGLMILAFAGAASAASHGAPMLRVGRVKGAPGSSVELPVQLDPGSASIASLQFDLTLPPALSTGAVTLGALPQAANKMVNSRLIGRQWRFLVMGTNQTALGPGRLLSAHVTIAPGTVAGPLKIQVSNVTFASPKAETVPPRKNENGEIKVGSN